MNKIISITRKNLSRTIEFTAEFTFPPSYDDVVNAQISEGKHPAGYGNPMRTRFDGVKATWECCDNCD